MQGRQRFLIRKTPAHKEICKPPKNRELYPGTTPKKPRVSRYHLMSSLLQYKMKHYSRPDLE